MESFVSELKQEVCCSLCKDRFIEPKLLKCFHTYCKACIKRHAELQPNGQGNIFKCPECLVETSLPELNDVEDLNPSPLHTRILKVLEFVESDKVCSVSKSHSTASWYCFDCSSSMCSDCQSCHSLFTKTDYNHEVVSLSNLRKEDVEFMLAREENCKDHVGYKLDIFCEDCKAVVCLVCVTRDHGDHKTIPNEKRSTAARATLEDHLETLDTREQELSSHLQALDNIAVKTRKEGEKTVQEVKKKAKELIEKVQEKERKLIEEIQGKIEKKEERKKGIQCILDQKKSTKRYINQMIEKKLPSSMTEKIIEMDVYSDDIVVLDDVEDDSQMMFVVSEEYSRMMNAELGTLATPKVKSEDKKISRDRDGWETKDTVEKKEDGRYLGHERNQCKKNGDQFIQESGLIYDTSEKNDRKKPSRCERLPKHYDKETDCKKEEKEDWSNSSLFKEKSDWSKVSSYQRKEKERPKDERQRYYDKADLHGEDAQKPCSSSSECEGTPSKKKEEHGIADCYQRKESSRYERLQQNYNIKPALHCKETKEEADSSSSDCEKQKPKIDVNARPRRQEDLFSDLSQERNKTDPWQTWGENA